MSDPLREKAKLIRRMILTISRPISAEDEVTKILDAMVRDENLACAGMVAGTDPELASRILARMP